MVTFIKYKKITIYNAIYNKVLYYGTVSYITFSTNDFFNANNNDTAFTEITRVLKNTFR